MGLNMRVEQGKVTIAYDAADMGATYEDTYVATHGGSMNAPVVQAWIEANTELQLAHQDHLAELLMAKIGGGAE